MKTNDKLQSMTRSPSCIFVLSEDCNVDVERQGETKMYFARDPISAKNLVTMDTVINVTNVGKVSRSPLHAKMQCVNCVCLVTD